MGRHFKLVRQEKEIGGEAKMKRTVLTIIFVLLCVCVLATVSACGTYIEANKPTGGTIGGNTDDPSKPSGGNDTDDDTFSVTLDYEGSISLVDLNMMQANWTNMESSNGATSTASFDKDGVATITGLDGDYRVTLSNVPDGYTYNPNIYTADNDEKNIKIKLYEITPVGGGRTGTNWYSDVCVISSMGAYRAVLTKENYEHGIRFQYEPKYAGDYTIESMIDITANKINPFIDMHSGTRSWVNELSWTTMDGGGEENTYTKNFKWEVQLGSNGVGNVFNFRIYATCVNEDAFPINVDFILDRDGEFSGGRDKYDRTKVYAEFDFDAATSIAFSGIKGSYKYFGISDDNGLLNGNRVKYFEDDGFYYIVDGDGNKSKRLYALLSTDQMYFITTEGGGGISEIPVNWIEEYSEELGKKVYFDYTAFVESYCANAENDVYPVTKELQIFLQRFCIANRYFNDGNGLAENTYDESTGMSAPLYKSTEANQWLCFCVYFESA